MSKSKHWSYRKNPRREGQIAAIGEATGAVGFSAAMDYALATAVSTLNKIQARNMNTRSIIENMNIEANKLLNASGVIYNDYSADEYASSALDALEWIADEYGARLVTESESCAIYQLPDGCLINCRIADVMSAKIEEGGLGFDDQIEWYDDN